VAKVGATEQSKALLEGKLSGLAVIRDSQVHNNLGQIKAMKHDPGKPGMTSFLTSEGGFTRHNTGSHIDVDSGSIMVGMAGTNTAKVGTTMLGAFFESGWGNYNTYNSFNNAPSVIGGGSTNYYGVGVFGRHDFNAAGPGNIYTETSLRTGRVKTSFATSDLGGGNTKYDSSSNYHGAHIGAGYLWKVMGNSTLDLSAKYLWTRTGSDGVMLATGDPIKFHSSDSHRVRTGGRFTYAMEETVKPYLGAYLDYELDGKANGTAYGYKIDAPSLRGATGIAEAGLTIQPSPSGSLFVDIGLQGYVGKREGFTGSAQLRYTF